MRVPGGSENVGGGVHGHVIIQMQLGGREG